MTMTTPERPPVRVRHYLRRLAWSLAALVLGVAFLLAARSSFEEGERFAVAKYRQISLGMTRKQVWDVMRNAEAMYTTAGSSDIMNVGERFMIVVSYRPGAGSNGSLDRLEGQPPADWVATDKVIVDLRRNTIVGNILVRLGLRRHRYIDRERIVLPAAPKATGEQSPE
jgi:hypothetical protein